MCRLGCHGEFLPLPQQEANRHTSLQWTLHLLANKRRGTASRPPGASMDEIKSDDSKPDSADAESDTQTVPEGCRVILVSPFEVHFSQTRIRSEFQDGRTLQEAMAQITSSSASRSLADTKEAKGTATEEEKQVMTLKAPFPHIEVTRWRCKLREADGAPKVDPNTGLELYSEEERWFTFDNRRLCCLQRAAAALWPDEVRCEVIEVPPTLARNRELRKFDTRTFGCSVLVGRRDDPNLETWSWRAAVGLPEEAQPEGGVGRQKSLRWRNVRNGGRGPGDRGGRRSGAGAQDGGEGGRGSLEPLRSALLFLMVYLALRLGVSVFRHRFREVGRGGGEPAPPPSVPSPPR